MHHIGHLNAFRNGFEMMLMMPKTKRTRPHLIHKAIRIFNMRDFSYPGGWKTKNCFKPISDDHPWIHLIRNFIGNFEIKP